PRLRVAHDERLIRILIEPSHLLIRRGRLRAQTDVDLELAELAEFSRRRLRPHDERRTLRLRFLLGARLRLGLDHLCVLDRPNALRRDELPSSGAQRQLRLSPPAEREVVADASDVPDLVLRS